MDKKAWILSRSYTDEALDGVGALKGAPCEIDSITPSSDGRYNTVTFKWEGTSGAVYTSDLIVYNGREIKALDIDLFGHLIVTYNDDTIEDAGELPVRTVEVGDTETVDYEEGAEVLQEDTPTGIKLNFKIPRGQPGTSDPVWNIV